MSSKPTENPTSKPKNRVSHWFSLILLSSILLFMLTFTLVVSLILWHPKTSQYALPYLEQLTDGQLKIESAEGHLIEGLQLHNVHYQSPEFNLEIQQLEWRWQLSALLINQLQFDKLHINQTKITLQTNEAANDSSIATAPFEIITQLNSQFATDIHIDDLQLTQSSLQVDSQPAIEVAKINSAVHWQDLNLRLERFSANYQTYRLQTTSSATIQDTESFEAHLGLKLLGMEFPNQKNEIALSANIKGGINQLQIQLETTQPYKSKSHHTLNMDGALIRVDSQWQAFSVNLHKQWQIENLQGNSTLQYQLDSAQITSQGKLELALANKPKATFEFEVDYPALQQTNSDLLAFKLHGQFKGMGTLQANGKVNLANTTANMDIVTQSLNLQWINPAQNYQIDSQLNWQLTDFTQRQSQLDIKQFKLTGLPETLIANGRLNTQLNAKQDYAVNLLSSKLHYANHTGKLQAKLSLKPDLSTINIDKAHMSLGNNHLDLSGQWSDKFALKLTAKLNQLEQLYSPVSGKIALNVSANGQVKKDFSGFNQAWSTVNLTASQIRYQIPKTENKTATQDFYTLKSLTLQGDIPLHQPEWSTLNVKANQLAKRTNIHQSQTLFTQLQITRQQPATKSNGLNTDIAFAHPDISIHAQFDENTPSFTQQTIRLNRFDITQPVTGNWALENRANIDWQSPNKVTTPGFCLHSIQDKQAKLCLNAKAHNANWSMWSLPVLEWLKPWINPSISLTGVLNGEGHAEWNKAFNLTQKLTVPQLDATITEQGFEIPMQLKEWQTDLQISPQTASLISQAQLNETGRLQADISSKKALNQAWSNAKIDGKITLNLNDWKLNKRALELIELQKTALLFESQLSGNLNAIKHSTQANLELKLNLPLLGLSDQELQLKADVTQDKVDANGTLKQPGNRQADLLLTLTDFKSQPKILASLKTDSIELLKTEFAHFNTSADINITLLEGATHIQGLAQLHNSRLDLEAMPLHERTQTSDDEKIIDPQGNVVPRAEAVSALSYDVKIGFGEQVKVNVRDAQVFLGGQLQLIKQGDSPDMQAFGEVKFTEGFIKLDARNRVEISESNFRFNGVIGNPDLNVNLFRVVDQTTARLNITGNATQPQFVFYSDPALSQGRIINLMIFGRAGDSTDEPNYESQVLSAFYKLGIQNNTPVLNTLTRTLGIEDVYFDVKNQKVSNLLVGRSLTDKLYVRYARDLTGQQNNAIQFFYKIADKWLLKSNTSDDENSVDLIYRLER